MLLLADAIEAFDTSHTGGFWLHALNFVLTWAFSILVIWLVVRIWKQD